MKLRQLNVHIGDAETVLRSLGEEGSVDVSCPHWLATC